MTSGEGAAADVRARLQQQLRTAMKARDTIATRALRATIGAIGNAEAVAAPTASHPAIGSGPIAGAVSGLGAADVARRELSDSDFVALVRCEIDERLAAAQEYERLGREDQAIVLRAECEALGRALE